MCLKGRYPTPQPVRLIGCITRPNFDSNLPISAVCILVQVLLAAVALSKSLLSTPSPAPCRLLQQANRLERLVSVLRHHLAPAPTLTKKFPVQESGRDKTFKLQNGAELRINGKLSRIIQSNAIRTNIIRMPHPIIRILSSSSFNDLSATIVGKFKLKEIVRAGQ